MKIVIYLFIGCMALLTGCGHNAVHYSDGFGIETTFRPDTGNYGFMIRYGKILSAVVRENAKVSMAGDMETVNGKEAKTTTKTTGAVNVEIGKQVTGYYVDALEAGATAEALNKYTE